MLLPWETIDVVHDGAACMRAWRRRGLALVLACAVACGASGCASRGERPLDTRGAFARPGMPVLAGWPVAHPERKVISPYGMRGGKMHEGVDIGAPRGTPVLAVAGGTVTLSGEQQGYGQIVVIRHDDHLETAYAHLDRRRVETGERVRGGQRIGDLGQSGNATTPHVHYEVRLRGTPVDPAAYLP